ncbi:MAG TPA: DUF748 domain-containing protein [Burkholderiales bacterium]|nr:DUF748 domain-containing protein [Burkholderiales bacterium]
MSGTEHEQKSDGPAARPRRPRWRRWAVALAACIGFYAVLGFWVVPAYIERSLPEYAQEVLKRKARVGEVRINPFLLTLEVKEFRLEEASGAPIAAVGRLFVDLELKSLLRWAWTVAQVHVEQPAIDLVLDADGTLNVARLAGDLAGPESAAAETSAPPRAILEHVVIAEGRVTLTDRSGAEPAQVAIAPLDLELHDISTLPERKGPYRLHATLPGGGSAQWEGEVSLQPIASTGRVRATGVKPASAWKLLRERVAIEEPAGSLDAELGYQFAYGRDGVQLSVDPVKLQLNGLRLAFTGAAEPALELEAAQVDGARFDLATRALTIPSVTVRGGRAAIDVDAKGELDWARILRRAAAGAGASAQAPATSAAAPWTLRLGAGRVESFGLRYRDASRKAASELAVDSLDARFALEARAGGGEPFALTLSPLDLELDGVSGGAPGEAPLLRFARMTLEGTSIDVDARKIRIAKAVVSGGTTQLVRAADGNVGGADLLNPRDEGKIQREVIAEARRAQAEGRPWAVSLEHLDLERFQASYRDETTQPALALAVKDFSATLQDISTEPDAVVPYAAQLVLAQGGQASVSGRFALSGDSADAALKLEQISLKPLAPMVSKLTILRLESGEVSGQAKIAMGRKAERATLAVDGALDVERLLLKEDDSGERFLAWRALQAKAVRYRSDPQQLVVKEVLLREPGAKIVVFKDRSVNLAKILKADPTKAEATAAAPAQAAGADVGPLPVVVNQVRVANGTIDFADESLVLPFAAKVEKLRGTANGIASDAKSRTTLKFEGSVSPFGEVRVGGSLAPFQPKRYTDIDVAFSNVEMSTLSPYSATFAGRKIASGRLDLGLKYKVENNALRGDNDIVLRDFTLGEAVPSSDAKDLPLDLAVALLKDSEGKIDLAVPVQGDIDNPEFSLSSVIMGALGTVLGNLVSAPFRALGGALGAGDGPADAVFFRSGRSVLAPPQQEKLKKLAEALTKRPQLRLTVHGGVDAAADGKALNERALRRALAEKLGLALGQDDDPEAVAYRDAKTQRALEAIAIERGGEGAVATFQAKFEKSAGRPARRVNPALALVGQGSDDDAFYRGLFDELVRSAPVPDAALTELAQQRAAEVRRTLTEGTSLAAARVTIGKREASSAGKDGVPSRLELGAPPG